MLERVPFRWPRPTGHALAHSAGRPGLLLAGPRSEQLVEEAAAGPRREVAGQNGLGRGRARPGTLRPLLHHLDHAALALDRRLHAAVIAVDVAADLQLAVVVDERGLIGQDDWNVGRELDIELGVAEHPMVW